MLILPSAELPFCTFLACACALQVVQSEPLRFPEDPPVSDELRDLLSQMLCKARGWGPLSNCC